MASSGTVTFLAVEAAPVAVELDSVRLSDWIDAHPQVSRSTAYELLKLLAIEPERRRVPGSRKPVSHLTADHVATLEPWALALERGEPLSKVRDRLKQSGIEPAARPGPTETVPNDQPEQSGIVPVEQMAALLGAVLQAQQASPPSPLARARALRQAAAEGLELTTTELSQLVGLSPAALERIDGKRRVMGYRLHRLRRGVHDPEQRWRIADPRQVGFRVMGDPYDLAPQEAGE